MATSAAAQPSGGCDEARARDAFDHAQQHYDAGRFRDAAELLEQALVVCADPALAYNLARSYEGMADLERAVTAYRRYLELAPEASDRVAVERRIENLESRIREVRKPPRAPAPAPKPSPQVPPDETSAPILPWIVAGGGVALIGAGVVTRVLAEKGRDDAKADSEQLGAVNRFDDAEKLATISNVLFVAGGVIAAGGITWILISRPSNKDTSLRFGVGPAGMAVRGRF